MNPRKYRSELEEGRDVKIGAALYPQSLEKLAYRIDDAAQVSGIGRTSLYQLIATGQLKAIKAAGRRLILRTDLERYLAACREAA